MKRLLFVAFALLAPALVGAADRPPQKSDEDLRAYIARILAVNSAVEEQAASPSGTAAASTFANRVNDSLQNFLPLFQGVIDGVSTSDDKKTVTVRFNPVRAARFGELGLTASATEPGPSEALLKLLPDDTRTGQQDAIKKNLDDFADLTYVATYNFVRPFDFSETELAKTKPRMYFGRNPRLYEELSAALLGSSLSEQGSDKRLEPFFDLVPAGKKLFDVTGAQLNDWVAQGQVTAAQRQDLVEALIDRQKGLVGLNNLVSERAKLFAQLVANQPQATLSATYHDRDPLVGPRETAVNLTLEMPAAANINELLRSRHKTGGWKQALTDLEARKPEIEAGTKWSLLANYTETSAYHVSYQPTTDGASPVGIDQPRSHELSIKGLYTRNATWQGMNIDGVATFPVMHLSAEILDVSGDPTRTERRVVGTLTYEIPMHKGMSIPLSLVYANHSEFLGDPDRQLSAHFGISFSSLFGN